MADDHAENISIKELYTRSHAIVIGISNYKEKKLRLKNPLNDAKEVAKVLKEKHGFTDIELVLDSDATKENLANIFEDRIRGQQITKDDRLLVYYSGHGDVRISYDQQRRKYEESYIIPVDARLGSYGSYLNLDTVTNNCQRCKAKHVLLILDSCYSGTAFLAGRGIDRPSKITDEYLRQIATKRSLQAVAATDKSQVALDAGPMFSGHSSEHGAFTGCLLDILRGEFDPDKDGILTASEVGAYLEKNVPRSRIPQNPIYGHLPGSEVGEFVFNLYNLSSPSTILSIDETSPIAKAASDYFLKKDYKKAIASYDKILEINPKHVESLTRKGISLMKLRRYKEARECFDRVLLIERENVEVLLCIETLEQLSARPRRMTQPESTERANTSDAPVDDFIKKVEELHYTGRYDEVIEACDKHIELYPHEVFAWSEKINALCALNKLVTAARVADKAVEVVPNPPNQLTQPKRTIRDDIEAAEENIERAKKWTIQYQQKYTAAPENFLKLEKYEEALEAANVFLKGENDWKAMRDKGIALTELGRYEEALQTFEYLKEILGRKSVFRKDYSLNMARLMFKWGRFDEANKFFRQSVNREFL